MGPCPVAKAAGVISEVPGSPGEEGETVAAYILCPHCEHPTVIPAAVLGRRYCCRQCHRLYVLRKGEAGESSNGARWRQERKRF